MKLLLPHQHERLSEKQLEAITIPAELEERIEAIMLMRNGAEFSDGAFYEMTINEVKRTLDYLAELREEYKNLIKDVKDLQHFKDTHVNLYATDSDMSGQENFFKITYGKEEVVEA